MTSPSFDAAVPLERLSGAAVAASYARSIVRSVGRALFKRVRRERDVVANEYHAGHWARVRAERAWTRHESLESYLVGERTDSIVAKVDGVVCRLACRDFYRYRLGALASLVESALGRDEELVELGAGYGYNLLALALAFPERRFVGLDLSPNGVETGREIARHFGLADRIRFDLIDLTDAAHPGFAHLRDRVALTFFCLEQIPYSIEGVVRNIAAGRPRRVLHVEPTVELLDLRRPADWANYVYVKSVDYQTQLFGVLRAMDARGEVKLIDVGRTRFAPTIQNDGFTAVWEPGAPR